VVHDGTTAKGLARIITSSDRYSRLITVIVHDASSMQRAAFLFIRNKTTRVTSGTK